MKHWQEKIPTFNLILINLILIFLIVFGFVIGPVNKLMKDRNDILVNLKNKQNIDSCYKLDSYTFSRELFTVNCLINEQNTYLFVDRSGIIYDRLTIDIDKEQNDYSQINELYGLKNAKYLVIYYDAQIAYWIKSDQFEYILDYDTLDIIMKVRF